MKKALCVGINDYPVRGSDLKGCVNDAHAWATVFTNHYGFAPADISLLLDRQATKAAMIAGIKRLLAGAGAGDVLVVTVSAHGTYVADTSGDEDNYDQAICPWDMTEHLIVDDQLRELFAEVPDDCRLTLVADTCFSGSIDRLAEAIETPDDRRSRFIRPRTLGLRELSDIRKAKPKRTLTPESAMRDVLISACRDNQTAADAKFGSTYHGALTFFALEILGTARYRMTHKALWDALVVRMDQEGFDQEPQIEGRQSTRRRRVFT